jgi:hypothetical protein
MMTAITTLITLNFVCHAMEVEQPTYTFDAKWDRTLLENCKSFTFTAKVTHKPIGTINRNNSTKPFSTYLIQVTDKPLELQKITLSVWHDWQANKRNDVSPKKEISTDQLLKIKKYIESIVSEQDREYKGMKTKNIMAEDNPNWIELYNFLAQLVNETFTEEPKITIFEPSKITLAQAPEQPTIEKPATSEYQATWSLNNPETPQADQKKEYIRFISSDALKSVGHVEGKEISLWSIDIAESILSRSYMANIRISYPKGEPMKKIKAKEITEKKWETVKNALEFLIKETKLYAGEISKQQINENEVGWVNLYNTVASLINDLYKNDNITIFKLEPKEDRPLIPAPEEQPVTLPIPKALQKFQEKATEKELQRQRPWSPSFYAAYIGGSSVITGGARILSSVVNPYLQNLSNKIRGLESNAKISTDDIKSAARYAAAGVTAAAVVSGLDLLKQYIFQAPVGFAEQLKKLNADNISQEALKIGGKDYLLARVFDNLDAAGYKDDWVYIQQHGYNQHYEIYFMPDDAHLIDLFLTIIKYLNESEFKDRIAFVALRPTPRIYNDYSVIGILSRQVLPRIIICLKGSGGIPTHKPIAQNIINAINNLIRSDQQFKRMKSEGYQPWGSQKLTPFISTGLGSLDYKRSHLHEFQAPRSWRTLYLSIGDMAYPSGREKDLRLESPK